MILSDRQTRITKLPAYGKDFVSEQNTKTDMILLTVLLFYPYLNPNIKLKSK